MNMNESSKWEWIHCLQGSHKKSFESFERVTMWKNESFEWMNHWMNDSVNESFKWMNHMQKMHLKMSK